MAVVQIRTIQRAKKDLAPVILRVEAADPSKLDLRLQATEGELQFKGKVKQKHLNDLRADAYKGADEEWSNIIRHTFAFGTSSLDLDEHLQSLQVTATVEGKDTKHTLKITFKRLVSNITQRLGEITLKEDSSLDIDTLPWTHIAISRADALQAEVTSLQRRYQETQNTITTLENRLEEFVKAKSAHEEDLLSKFAQLLNEKKLKIRNQQRLLSTAQVNPSTLQEVKDTLKATGRTVGPSRKGKRQASKPPPQSHSESSDDFETAQPRAKSGSVNTKKENQGKESSPPQDSNADDDFDRHTTATDTESGSDTGTGARRRSTSSNEIEGPPATSSNTVAADERMDVDEEGQGSSPPPRRELPHLTRDTSGSAKTNETGRPTRPPAAAEEDSGEETASATDDEL